VARRFFTFKRKKRKVERENLPNNQFLTVQRRNAKRWFVDVRAGLRDWWMMFWYGEALFAAVRTGNVNFVKTFLTSASQVKSIGSLRDKNSNTLLHYAVFYNCIEIVRLFVSCQWSAEAVRLNTKDSDGYSSLYYAFYKAHINIIALLVNSNWSAETIGLGTSEGYIHLPLLYVA